MSSTILELNDFHYYYGEIHAVKGISLHVDAGEIVAIIGANGSGKTTTLRSISGLLGTIKHGEIKYMGENLTKLPPHIIAKRGIGHVLEGRHIFSQLTVKENLLLGCFENDKSKIQNRYEYVYNLFPRLKEREKQKGGTLSGGEQQMLAIGRGLMGSPQLLLLDEPSLGLAPIIVEDIFKILHQINRNGTTILLVEQNSKAALNVANRGYVLETGRVVLAGESNDLLNNEQVKKSYLGE